MGCPNIPDELMQIESKPSLGFDMYKPTGCTWQEAYARAMNLIPELGAVRLIELRVDSAGCFIAKYYFGSLRGGEWVDQMYEIKVYDNTEYLKGGSHA